MPGIKKIALLGSTGSIGTQTLDVLENIADEFSIFALTAGKNITLLIEQIEKYQPKIVCIAEKAYIERLCERFPEITVLHSDTGPVSIARHPDVDIVINAIVGAKGLEPSWGAVDSGKRLCTANKESLVMAGSLLAERTDETSASIFPIDSEHSALWQAMLAGKQNEIRRLILTASGGPFWGKDIDFDKITPEQALAHPNWSMGAKISIDSATMMNKALEIIEARWLFDIPHQQIEIIIHPQSIVHSIVEFIDGSQIAQLSMPDMRLPIQYALTYPERLPSPIQILKLSDCGKLEFFAPDNEKFIAPGLAYKVLETGGSAPTILNTVNELAVEAFIAGKITFSEITKLVENGLEMIPAKPVYSLEEIFTADRISREWCKKRIDGK